MTAKYLTLQRGQPTLNPKDTANILSSLSFWWLGNIFKVGKSRPLENEDLFLLLDEDRTQFATEKLLNTWREVSPWDKTCKKKRKFRLLRALVLMFPWQDYMFLLTIAMCNGLSSVLQPVFLSLLLPELISPSAQSFSWSVVYASGICVSSFMEFLTEQHYIYKSSLVEMRWRSGVIGVLLNKVLQLKQADFTGLSHGYVLDLICNDVHRFEKALKFLVASLHTIFQVLFLSFLMCYLFGWSSVTGILFFVFLVIVFVSMGALCVKIRSKIAEATDERLRVMVSIIDGIRTVKMYGWEGLFREKVQQIRRQEVKLIRLKSAILALLSAILYTSQPMASFISVVAMAAVGTQLTSYNAFMVLSVVSILRVRVSWYIGRGLVVLGDFATAIERIEALLDFGQPSARDELQMAFLTEGVKSNVSGKEISYLNNLNGNVTVYGDHTISTTDQVILLDITCSWTGDRTRPTLNNLSLTVPSGDLVFITGCVGCGKSSLLLSILNELPACKGHMSCHGNIAYVGQYPWVFCGTVQDNILFGRPLDAERYNKALQACELHQDIQRFPDGDLTKIGEHGIVLSGGQRARVSLARAVYADADIYLLDDPLSAVDAKVGKNIYEKCINGILKSKTRLLVTYSLQLLQTADHIVLMKDGSMVAEGDFEAISKAGFDLKYEVEPELMKETKQSEVKTTRYQISTEGNSATMGLERVDEDRMTGAVSWALYWRYLRAGLGVTPSLILLVFFPLIQGSLIVPDRWVLEIIKSGNQQTRQFYIYGGMVSIATLLIVIRAFLAFHWLIRSSNHLHDSMLSALLRTPVLFFDTNPTGRILNRFSRDIGIMDEILPDIFFDAVQILLFCFGSVVLLSLLNPWIILAAVPLVLMFIVIGRYYIRTSRELRRLEALNRSPVLSHFSDTLEGLVRIKAYRQENAFFEELFRRQDSHNQACFMIMSANCWVALRLDLLCVAFVAIVLFSELAVQSAPGVTALSIVYALQLVVGTSNFAILECSQVESLMTSVERVITYTELQQEPGYNSQSQPLSPWPDRGQIRVQNLSFVYYPGGPQVLKDVNFTINPREKVAVAGRTGAGKSSLVAALFRMPQPTGDVIIDNVNINSINLQSSRKAMSVITQNPVLFTGSLRMNLDPFIEHSDKELWEALEGARLKAMVQELPNQLNHEIHGCGGNLSVGERQLLCLARALLKKSRIIILDEATANVDYKTDQLIQETIRTKFKGCTVLTIAHRLNTILDYDRVLVMENGRVVEFDQPKELLKKVQGVFKALHDSFILMASDEKA